MFHREYSIDVCVVDITESKDGKRVKKQCEIDFVVNKDAKQDNTQVGINLSFHGLPFREAFINIAKKLKLVYNNFKPKTVERRRNAKGI